MWNLKNKQTDITKQKKVINTENKEVAARGDRCREKNEIGA